MKKPITVTVTHQHTKEEAKRRIRDGLSKLAPQLAAVASIQAEPWQGDSMGFRTVMMKQEASGQIHVTDSDVTIEVTLPWLLHTIAEKLQGQIQRNAKQILLEKK